MQEEGRGQETVAQLAHRARDPAQQGGAEAEAGRTVQRVAPTCMVLLLDQRPTGRQLGRAARYPLANAPDPVALLAPRPGGEGEQAALFRRAREPVLRPIRPLYR